MTPPPLFLSIKNFFFEFTIFQGSWNCDLSSMPAGEQGDLYFEDQQYFNLKTIKAPDVKFSHVSLGEPEKKFVCTGCRVQIRALFESL